jgi:hypothetical protein
LLDGFSLNLADTDNKESQSECTEETKRMRPPESQEIKGPSAGRIN